MQESDRKRFAAVLTAIAEYYGKELTAPVIGLYWQGLEHFDIEAIERAVSAHIRNSDNGQFMPKVSDLSKMIQGSTQDRASTAWTKVHYAIRSVGPYQSLVFDDPLIHAVLEDMGGFGPLCDVRTDDMPFRAKEFETRYRNYAMRSELPEYPQKILGDHEAHNRAAGYISHVTEPVFIGDRDQAQKVLAGIKAVAAIEQKAAA